MTDTPLYPDITVRLTGLDGNAFAILGRVNSALRRNNVPREVQDKFATKAIDGDYDHLLQTVREYVTVT